MSERIESDPDVTVSDEALQKAEQYIEEEEGAANRLGGWLGVFLSATAIVMSLFHMYAAYAIVPTQTLRPIHVGRSEERRVGKECVSTCRSRWSPYHSKKKQHKTIPHKKTI